MSKFKVRAFGKQLIEHSPLSLYLPKLFLSAFVSFCIWVFSGVKWFPFLFALTLFFFHMVSFLFAERAKVYWQDLVSHTLFATHKTKIGLDQIFSLTNISANISANISISKYIYQQIFLSANISISKYIYQQIFLSTNISISKYIFQQISKIKFGLDQTFLTNISDIFHFHK